MFYPETLSIHPVVTTRFISCAVNLPLLCPGGICAIMHLRPLNPRHRCRTCGDHTYPRLKTQALHLPRAPPGARLYRAAKSNGILHPQTACLHAHLHRSNACSNRHGDGVRGLNPKAAVPTVQGRIPAPAGSPWPGDSPLHPHHYHREQRTIILAICSTRQLQLELLVCRRRMHRLARLPQNVLLLDVLVNVLSLVLEDTFHT